MNNNISRRQFVKNLGGLGLSALTASSLGLSGLLSSSSAMAQTGGHKALVYVYLFGGNDSFNMVVPQESGVLRRRYESGRGRVALEADDLHTLNLRSNAQISSGESYNGFGMHPECGDLADMFNDGEMGVLSNIGNLIEPTNRSSFSNSALQLPPQLFSHADQSRQLLSEPTSTIRYGWGGRIAEILGDEANPDDTLSPLVSTAGLNSFQLTLNREISTYSTGVQGPTALRNNTGTRSTMLDGFMRAPSFDLFTERYRDVYDSGVMANATVGQAFDIANSSGVDYDDVFSSANANTRLGDQLKAVAKLIAGREASSNSRPVYFVRIGGFDQHSSLLEDHAERMQELNNGLKAFRDVLIEQGDFADTLTHITSEFGRTFAPNSSGTDHGWGGNMMVMGGPVNGGHMFGTYPDLVLGGERDADSRNRGRWIPQTSTHQAAAVISDWLGVQRADLNDIFPTLASFNDPFEASENLNFIRQGA